MYLNVLSPGQQVIGKVIDNPIQTDLYGTRMILEVTMAVDSLRSMVHTTHFGWDTDTFCAKYYTLPRWTAPARNHMNMLHVLISL